MPLIRTVLKRLGLLVVTLLLVTILAFVAFSILPGDPTTSILGVDATDEQIAALRDRLGLDLPLWQRYLDWVGGLLTGDLGESYNYAMPVAELLGSRVAVTATLAGMAFVLIVVISLPLGILCARYEGGVVDRVVTVLDQITMSIPNFLLGFVLTYVFSLVLHWFTVGSFSSAAEQGVGAYLGYLFFPALAIALP